MATPDLEALAALSSPNGDTQSPVNPAHLTFVDSGVVELERVRQEVRAVLAGVDTAKTAASRMAETTRVLRIRGRERLAVAIANKDAAIAEARRRRDEALSRRAAAEARISELSSNLDQLLRGTGSPS